MKIVLLGSGNVATHLGKACHQAGHQILQVWSRNKDHALELAREIHAEAIDDLRHVNRSADMIILAVKDEAIAWLAAQLKDSGSLLVHTSGSVSLQSVSGVSSQAGVLYPLQTFSKDRAIDFRQIPLCIEANSPQALQQVRHLAESISSVVYELTSEKRKALHVAAVFVCNFVNYLYTIGKDIGEKEGLDFSMLLPLIRETAAKIQTASPEEVQTGPAKRGDTQILESHLTYLNQYPDYQKVYELLSQQLINLYGSKA